MLSDPGTKGAGGKTHLESGMKKFKRLFLYVYFFRRAIPVSGTQACVTTKRRTDGIELHIFAADSTPFFATCRSGQLSTMKVQVSRTTRPIVLGVTWVDPVAMLG